MLLYSSFSSSEVQTKKPYPLYFPGRGILEFLTTFNRILGQLFMALQEAFSDGATITLQQILSDSDTVSLRTDEDAWWQGTEAKTNMGFGYVQIS